MISLLNEPNINSAADVDASVAYRKWIESKGKENMYEKRVRLDIACANVFVFVHNARNCTN